MLLCNAGIAVEYQNEILLVDVLNASNPPFAGISDVIWQQILKRKAPFDKVCGVYFTHIHPDHCDLGKVLQYRNQWPDIPCWLPDGSAENGDLCMGPFSIEYSSVYHAPMDEPLPKHVVSWIKAGEKRIYIAADAALPPEPHMTFLNKRTADAAFWNSMYLSRPETRALLNQTSPRNYIYHMPESDPDGFGIWKKCKNNLLRYPEELRTVRVIKRYPTVIEI